MWIFTGVKIRDTYINLHSATVSEITRMPTDVGESSGRNIAEWGTAGHKLCQLTVILIQEFCTRTRTFYVAAQDGSSNVRTATFVVLFVPQLRATRVTRVAAVMNRTVSVYSCTATGVNDKMIT